MKKEEYLHELETRLKRHLPKTEINDILRDYGEYFEDGRRQNKSDTEISAKLGQPELIAQQFIEEYKEEKKENEPVQELTKIKESAVKSVSEWKEKVDVSGNLEKVGNGFKGVFTSAWSGERGTGGPMKRGLYGLVHFLERSILFCCYIVLELIFLSILGTLVGSSLYFLCFGVMGILGFLCTFGFISVYFTVSGVLFFIAVTCAGLLCVLLTVYLIRLNIRWIKKYWKPKKLEPKEGDKSYV